MAATRRLTELAKVATAKLRLPAGPVTVALSGGADSAALAYLCAGSSREMGLVHVDHGLPASQRLAEAAKSIATALATPLETVSVVVEEGPSPEERAREARYQVFDTRDQTVLTGHTQDDNAETILINLIRGTGPAGLTGIPYHRPPNTYRPMLSISRSETRELAALAGLAFFDDPMNDDFALARNRVRHQVLPLLAEMNPRIVESLARTATAVDRDHAFLDSLVPETGESAGVPTALALTLPRPVADRLLQRILLESDVGVTADRMQRVWSVVTGETESQDLTGGRRVTRRGALVVVE
jgi:tRNA(Ile)-lysidine synthase